MTAVEKMIYEVRKLSNEELKSLIKEVDFDNKNKNLSPKADRLFKIYDDSNWQFGLDRFNEIVRCLEIEIINRIKDDLL